MSCGIVIKKTEEDKYETKRWILSVSQPRQQLLNDLVAYNNKKHCSGLKVIFV